MNRIQQDNGRQSQAGSYRNDGAYRGDENGDSGRQGNRTRSEGPPRYGDTEPVRYGDDARSSGNDGRYDDGRGYDRGESQRYGPSMRRDSYDDTDGYQDRSRGNQGQMFERTRFDEGRDSGRGYGAANYGRGGRDERSDYGDGRGMSRGREGGFNLSDWENQRGRSFTGESYGGSFAGPYAPRSSSWDSREWRGSRDQGGAGPSYGSMGSMDSIGSTGGSWGRPREDRGSSSRSGSSTMERESHRGRGPKGYQRADQRIQEDLQERLTDDGDIDASDIEVNVKEGEITLNGTVSERAMKRRAEDLAEAISGSKHVQNNLRVKREGAGTESKERSTSGASVSSQSGASQAGSSQSGASTSQGQAHQKGNTSSGNSGGAKN